MFVFDDRFYKSQEHQSVSGCALPSGSPFPASSVSSETLFSKAGQNWLPQQSNTNIEPGATDHGVPEVMLQYLEIIDVG